MPNEIETPEPPPPAMECADCGGTVAEGDDHLSTDGGVYCADCYGSCAVCRESFPSGDLTSRRGVGEVCSSCDEDLYRCEDCGDYVHSDSLRSAYGGDRSICEGCFEDHYSYCYECEETVHSDDIRVGDDDECRCPSCHDSHGTEEAREEREREQRRTAPIGSGSTMAGNSRIFPAKSHPPFQPKRAAGEVADPAVPLFGIELEFLQSKTSSAVPTTAQVLAAVNPDLHYVQTDSSCWLELTTQPFSAAHWAETGRVVFEGTVAALNAAKARSWDGDKCGLHVHCSRPALGKWGARRLVAFALQNEPEIFSVSGRTAASKRWTLPIPKDKSEEQLLEGGWSRYSILNIEPQNTVELRFMRGTFKNPTWSAALPMAMFRYILSIPDESVFYADWSLFVDYLRRTEHVIEREAFALLDARGVLRELPREVHTDEGQDVEP